MRILLYLTTSFLMCSACNDNAPGSRKEPFATDTWTNSIARVDTTCLHEVAEARADLQSGKLVFCKRVGFHIEPLADKRLMDSLLGKFGMTYKLQIISDMIIEDQTPACYCRVMDDSIVAKYGRPFLDSLRHAVDSIAAKTNPIKQ